ncbi:MAG: hypothetical protein D6715_13260, partial [Calditrichaeota bacterium]
MKQRLGWCLPALIWLLLCGTALAQVSRQVITRQDLARAGMTRWGDLPLLLADWQSLSTDGFRRDAVPLVDGNLDLPDWDILLDGVPVEMRFFNLHRLNLLPVSLNAVDSIRVTAEPVLEGGLLVQRPRMEIFTRRPLSTARVQGRFATGNESGDPGPFLYTSRRSPNVDELGPDYQAGFALGGRQAGLQGGGRVHYYPATDPVLTGRLGRVPWVFLRVQATAFWLGVAPQQAAPWPRLHLGFATTAHPGPIPRYGSDLFFFAPLNREVPANSEMWLATAGGRLRAGAWGIAYRAGISRQRIDSPEGSPFVLPLWRLVRAHAGVQATRTLAAGRLALDVETGQTWFTRQTLPADNRRRRYRVALGWSGPAGGTLHYALSAAVESEQGRVSPSGMVQLTYRTPAGRPLRLKAGFLQEQPASADPYWFWVGRGYTGAAALGVQPRFVNAGRTGKRWFVALSTGRRPGSLFPLQAGLYLAHDWDRRALAFDAGHPDSLRVGALARGTGLWLRLKLDYRSQKTRQLLAFTARITASGNTAYQAMYRRLAARRLNYQGWWNLQPDLSLWWQFSWQSSTFWPRFQSGNRLALSAYAPELPARALLHLAVGKQLLGRRVAA